MNVTGVLLLVLLKTLRTTFIAFTQNYEAKEEEKRNIESQLAESAAQIRR